MAQRIDELFYDLGMRTAGFDSAITKAETKLKTFAATISAPTVAVGALAAVIVGVGLAAAAMAAQVESGLRRVAGSVPQGVAGMNKLRETVRDLSVETGRSQAELADFAAEIARIGSQSAEEVAQRLRAATTAADATGTDLTTIIQGLDQTLDLFGKSGRDAEEVLGNMFAAAKGKAPLEDLFASLQAAAPAVNKFGIDIDTATRAIIALGEHGLSARQAGAEIAKLGDLGEVGRQRIQALAGEVAIAAGGFRDMQAAAAANNNELGKLGDRLRAELSAVLTDLGRHVLPLVVSELRGLLGLIDKLTGAGSKIETGSAIATVSALGPLVNKLGEEGQRGAKGLKDLQQEALNLASAVSHGNLELKELSGDRLAALRDGIKAILDSGRIESRIKRPLQPLLSDIDALIARAPKAAQSVAAVGAGGKGKGGFESADAIRARIEAVKALRVEESAAAKERLAIQERAASDAGAVLDEITRKSASAQSAIGEALTTASVDLARMAGDTVAVLDAQIAQLTIRFRNLGASDAEIAKIVAPLEAARRAATALHGAATKIEISPAAQKALGAIPKPLETAATEAFSLSDAMSDVLTTAYGVATALGGANSELTRALGGAAQLATSFAKISGLAKEAGGLGALLSSGAGIASAIPAIGGVIGGVGAIISALGKSPAEQERAKALQENSKALLALRTTLGDALKLSSSGSNIGGVTTALGGVDLGKFTTNTKGKFGEFVRQQAFEAFAAQLRKLGLTMDDARKIATDLGIDLDKAGVQGLKDFKAALDQLDFAAFTDTFAGQLSRLNNEFELFPDRFKTSADKFAATVALLNDPKLGAPALFAGLEGIDTSTSEGAAAALKQIQDIFDRLKSGQLTAAELNGLSLSELLDVLRTLRGDLDLTTPEIVTQFETLQKALADLATEMDALDIDDVEERAKRIVAAVAGLVPSIADALAGLDVTTLGGANAADDAIAELFKDRASLTDAQRGGLSIDEFVQALLELDRALDSAKGSLKDAVEAAKEKAKADEDAAKAALDDAAREKEDARAKAVRDRLKRAQDESTFAGDDASEHIVRLQKALEELSPAFAGLLDGIDLDTAEGVFAFNQRLKTLFESMAEGGELGTLSMSELLQALLDLRAGSDSAAGSLDDLATAAEELAATVSQAIGELEFGLELEGVTDPLERLKRTIASLSTALPSVADALKGFDVSSPEGRKAAIEALMALGKATTDDVTRDAILRLLDGLRGIVGPEAVGAGDVGNISGAQQGQIDRALQSIGVSQLAFNPQFERMMTLDETRNVLLGSILGAILGTAAPVSPPYLGKSFGGAPASGGVVITIAPTIVIELPGVTGVNLEEFQARALAAVSGAMVQVIDQGLGNNKTVKDLLRGNLGRGPLN